ncbi:MAG: glycoside hydrolase family 130 protein [Chloroflexota bacterium]|nr:MAG: glycosidase [Chloroflexota bacterium]
MSVTEQAPFQLHRIATIMEPDPQDPLEAWGVLNPASARKDGELYLFPRVVAEGNYSRIGIARVEFDEHGNPCGAERLGYVLEPEELYERSARSTGGVEDPRITRVEPLDCWVMAYTAVSWLGPRIALAVSDDLFHWRRLGLMQYERTRSIDFSEYGNKDAIFFPEPVLDPRGRPALAMLHRPTYLVHRPDGTVLMEVPDGIEDRRESIWIAYLSLDRSRQDVANLVHVYDNELLVTPQEPWECLKMGGGTPPVRVPEGWLTYYHGVEGTESLDPLVGKHVEYRAGALVLDIERPTTILYRSPCAVLEPGALHEQEGIVNNVVFPTAIDQREQGRLDVYYGMADSRIGVATSTTPEHLPAAPA